MIPVHIHREAERLVRERKAPNGVPTHMSNDPMDFYVEVGAVGVSASDSNSAADEGKLQTLLQIPYETDGGAELFACAYLDDAQVDQLIDTLAALREQQRIWNRVTTTR